MEQPRNRMVLRREEILVCNENEPRTRQMGGFDCRDHTLPPVEGILSFIIFVKLSNYFNSSTARTFYDTELGLASSSTGI